MIVKFHTKRNLVCALLAVACCDNISRDQAGGVHETPGRGEGRFAGGL